MTGSNKCPATLASDHASPAAEREADGAAMLAAIGEPVPALSAQPATIARQEDLGTQSEPPVPLSPSDVGPTGGAGTTPLADPPGAAAKPFQDNFTTPDVVNPVAIPARLNARDFLDNLHLRFGDDGGHTKVSPANVNTSIDAVTKKVVGATVAWTITETVPIVPKDTPLTGTELAVCESLVKWTRQHEDGHAAIERKVRSGFAQSLNGVKDADVDDKLKALSCRVGKAQRDYDKIAGKVDIDSNNQLKPSPVDHPDYEDDCPKKKGP